jgi:chloride channel protein, CIC family
MKQDGSAGHDQRLVLGTSVFPAQKFANGVGLPNTESTDRTSSEAPPNSAQPNVLSAVPDDAQMTVKMWIMVLLTGIGAGITSGLLMRLLRLVQHLSFSYSAGDFLTGVRNTSAEHRIFVVSLGGVVAGLSLYLLRRTTGGSGADVTGAIWHKQSQFDAAPTIAKSLISIVIVGMGAAIGREAALKDMGGTVAGKISDWTCLSREQRHLLVACGAGAGMAAAYNVPLGGALFAVEVLLGTMSLTNVLAAIITSFMAVAVSWLLLPNVPTFNVAQLSITPSLLLWSALAGPILGAASAVYVRFIGWAETGKPKKSMVIIAPILVFICLGFLSVHFPEILGNGKNVVQEAFGSQLGAELLCLLLILRPLATAMCLKSGAPGGLFTPTMTFGALLGGLLGEGWSHLAPATSKDSYAIVGAGAMLASASQGPISSVVFMLELTNHTDALIVPLLIAVAGATLMARKLEVHSIYSIRG